MSASPSWAKVRVVGDEAVEYTRRIGRIPLPHGERLEIDLVRRDVLGAGPGDTEVRLAGIRLGPAQAELVAEWIWTAVALAHAALPPDDGPPPRP
jgi:hypothetical protein